MDQNPHILSRQNILGNIQTKFGFSLRKKKSFEKLLTATTDDDDGCQVLAIAHMDWWPKKELDLK